MREKKLFGSDVIKILMKVKIVRRLYPEDILKIEKKLERKTGMTFEEFEEKFNKGARTGEYWHLYVGWAKIHRAYKVYEEEGEVDITQKKALNITIKELLKILTEKKIELIDEIRKGANSISNLARRVKRDVTNVHRDLKILEKYGIIRLEKDGKRLRPKLLVKQIILEFT